MGYESRDVTVRISCRVSRHNSERDARDDALVDELQERINNFVRGAISDLRYAELEMYAEGLDT